MKVRELIERLQAFDLDLPVVIGYDSGYAEPNPESAKAMPYHMGGWEPSENARVYPNRTDILYQDFDVVQLSKP